MWFARIISITHHVTERIKAIPIPINTPRAMNVASFIENCMKGLLVSNPKCCTMNAGRNGIIIAVPRRRSNLTHWPVSEFVNSFHFEVPITSAIFLLPIMI